MAIMIAMFPPSPALSACDSLDGIDDLDAFLEAQGRLSHFPTPPLKKQAVVEVVEVCSIPDESAILDSSDDEYYGDDEDEDLDDVSIAELFAEQTCLFPSLNDISSIRTIITRSRLPVEVLAVAYNILSKLGNRHHRRRQRLTESPDLLVISCLALAEIYTDDYPAQSDAWSRDVTDNVLSAAQIDSTMLAILKALDWRLHPLTAPEALQRGLCILAGFIQPDLGNDLRLEDVEAGMLEGGVQVVADADGELAAAPTTRLTASTTTASTTDFYDDGSDTDDLPSSQEPRLKLLIEQSIRSASWVNGLLTPDTAPTSPAMKMAPSLMMGIDRSLSLL
ncbi:hypothetical protein K431DRAFT_35629 [Polychaeton citri CBS 116435]|uniref:Cyclin N-terminal domain-containing protein n=1 Tax=Polychaeton citri CBS 116435 TaxID=1314669 RepID=A0A9P4USA1_9PEZI|nr:hypothetical protein K431DRAFT_35629 [Polychaeton citri CBS 116435]